MRNLSGLAGLAILTMVITGVTERALAQQTMTAADVQRLELNLNDARNDVSALRKRDAALAATLQKDLESIADEVTYLRVKMTKEGSVPRSDYVALRDRIDDLRARAGAHSPQAKAATNAITVPVGTEIQVRLQTPLNSGTSQVEDRFEATTVADVTAAGKVAIPAGSLAGGIVAAVDKASRSDRKGSLTLAFDRVTVRGTAYAFKGTVVGEVKAGTKGEVAKIGGGATAGAIIGGLLGGGKGAAIGAIVGGGGMVAATPGSDVDVPVGTVLTVRVDSALTVR